MLVVVGISSSRGSCIVIVIKMINMAVIFGINIVIYTPLGLSRVQARSLE
jgi:hypothetical protein